MRDETASNLSGLVMCLQAKVLMVVDVMTGWEREGSRQASTGGDDMIPLTMNYTQIQR